MMVSISNNLSYQCSRRKFTLVKVSICQADLPCLMFCVYFRGITTVVICQAIM